MTITLERERAQALLADMPMRLRRRSQAAQTISVNLPELYPLQRQAICDPARYSVIEASVKSGKTLGCIVWLISQAIQGSAGQHYWWVAPVRNQARIAYDRAKRMLAPAQRRANETDLSLTLMSGAIITFKSGELPDNLYGEDVHAAVVDEASRVREDAFFALRTTLTATRGPIRLIGNVKGRRNWAYRLARRAESGEPDMAYHKLTAFDAIAAGILTEAEIADARRQLPESVFNELYLAEASDDESNPFGIASIRECTVAGLSTAPSETFGWDLARKEDYTVGIGIDADGGVAHFSRFQADWEATINRILRETTARAAVDSTGVGDPIVERLIRHSPRLFHGYQFTSQSKQALMERLAVAIQSREVSFPAGPIVAELEQYEYEYTRTGVRYAAASGAHDDCVVALALAVYQRQHKLKKLTVY